MSVFHPSDDKKAPDSPPAAAQKTPYKKPDFLHEQVFETMALACGKISPTSSQCRSVRKNS